MAAVAMCVFWRRGFCGRCALCFVTASVFSPKHRNSTFPEALVTISFQLALAASTNKARECLCTNLAKEPKTNALNCILGI